MAVRGDFRGLENLRAKLTSLATTGARTDLCRVLAEASMKQLDDEFQQSRDPYGKPWAPLTSRTGKPLADTGTHLQGSLNPKWTDTGWTIVTAFVGAAVHQYGALIKAKTSHGLRFRVRGTPTKSSPRGELSGWITKQQVTIPQRQYMPEGDVGPIWRTALERQTEIFLRQRMGGR